MLNVSYRKGFVRIEHVWFTSAHKLILPAQSNADIFFFHGIENCTLPFRQILVTKQLTIIKDLSPSTDEIWESLGKHLKQHIKKSSKEGTVLKLFHSDMLRGEGQSELLDGIQTIYEKIYADKGMKVSFNRKLVKQYINKDALLIAAEYIDGSVVGFDAVIFNNKYARLWLSAHDFRNKNCDSQIISRAHQYLQWTVLVWCKEHGIEYFDFGGISSFSEPNGIDHFKMQFEKENRTQYNNILAGRSTIGKLIVALYARKNRVVGDG